ncbi:HAD family phosphatase [Vallitaleaceae bacterium 9-2]
MFDKIKAAIFDMDGTLVDSMWLWKTIDIDYLAKHNLELPEDLQESIEGMSFSETAAYFKKRFVIEDDVETIKEEWNTMAADYYQNRVPLKENVLEFIQHLRDRDIKLGIGTSNSKELAQMIVQKYALESHFDSVRTSCEVNKGKPHPDIFLKVAQDLGVHPSECIVFEDIPNGLLAAKRAGMRVVAIDDDFSKELVEEKRELSDFFIYSYNEAIQVLLKGI